MPDYSIVGISMECYSIDKYADIKEDGNNTFTFEYYLPCKKISTSKEFKISRAVGLISICNKYTN